MNNMEKTLYNVGIDYDMGVGHATIVARAIHTAINTIKWGTMVDERTAIEYIVKVMKSVTIQLMIIRSVDGGISDESNKV